jgi:hypothetical protein
VNLVGTVGRQTSTVPTGTCTAGFKPVPYVQVPETLLEYYSCTIGFLHVQMVLTDFEISATISDYTGEKQEAASLPTDISSCVLITTQKRQSTLHSCLTHLPASVSLASLTDSHSMPDLLSATAGPGALSAPAPQRGEVPPGRSFTAAGLSVLLPPSSGPGPRTTRGQSSQTCTLLLNHAASGLLPSAGRGRDALGLDNSEDALLPTEPLTDPRLDSRPVRIDATRTAYSGYPLPHQPSPEASTVCFVLPRAQPVTRDSRNRATRARHMKR